MRANHSSGYSFRVYADDVSASPLDARVASAMRRADRLFGNPSSTHAEGREAKRALENVQKGIAELLSVKKDEILFTSGGTESNNLAILGFARALTQKGHAYRELHFITTQIEHPSVKECFEELERLGSAVSYLPVSAEGMLEEDALKKEIRKETVLLSIALLQGELGVLQSLRSLTHSARQAKRDVGGLPLYIHTDASQAPLYVDVSPHAYGVDFLTLDASKMYGPKGVGMLYRALPAPLSSILFGGGQQYGLRPGTEHVSGAVGLQTALQIAYHERKQRIVSVATLHDLLMRELATAIPEHVLNGHLKRRTPHIVNVSIPGVDAEFATVILDNHGVSLSTRSACFGTDGGGSEVVRAITGDAARATSAIRISLSERMTRRDVVVLVKELREAAQQAKLDTR